MNATQTPIRATPPAPPTPAAIEAIPFARLFRVEWSKAVDTRAARWLIAITAVGTMAIMLAPALATGSIEQTYRNYLDFPTFIATTLLPIAAILTMTTEWTQRTVLTTFTQEPRRGRVVAAKVGAGLLLGLFSAAFVALVTVATVWLVEAGGRDVHGHLSASELVGFVLFVLLNMLLAIAFGAVLHNTAAAIVLIFVVPIGFGFLGEAVPLVHRWFDPSTALNHVLAGHWGGHELPILVGTTLWIALPLAAGVVRTLRREIK
jgi:ABC-2 type transport system permease protein